MRNILVVTGGAGFIGSNLISELLKFKEFNILSIDNYSSGLVKNYHFFTNNQLIYIRDFYESCKFIKVFKKKRH